jgi:hypothetical protein
MSAQYHDLRHVLASLRSRLLLVGGLALLAFVVSAALLALGSTTYRVQMVVAPVGSQRAPLSLQGAASSLLGGTVQVGGGGFDATQAVVAYLLKTRAVLLNAVDTVAHGEPLSAVLVDLDRARDGDERLLAALRRELKVTQSKETRFVVIAAKGTDSAALRSFVSRTVQESQRLFIEVAQAQARELLRAQERRVDSAEANLRRAEERLLVFNEKNRLVPPRSRLQLEKDRLDREVSRAVDVVNVVNADRESAIARELEDAPALAVVEPIPATLSPLPREVLFRSTLGALLVGVAALLVLFSGALLKGTEAEARGPAATSR